MAKLPWYLKATGPRGLEIKFRWPIGLFVRLKNATPYWVHHIVVAALIQLAVTVLTSGFNVTDDPVTVGVASGVFFYAGREQVQYADKGYFDWPGFMAPLVACNAVGILLRMLSAYG